MKNILLVFFAVSSMISPLSINAQNQTINLINPSLEGTPKRGMVPKQKVAGFVTEPSFDLEGWESCGDIHFRNESAPDIHPLGVWSVTKKPADGNSYVGLVTRDNDSYESISQTLESTLEKGKCYSFSLDIARSEKYLSGSRLKKNSNKEFNYTKPVTLRIWGGNGSCNTRELLFTSGAINNKEWSKLSCTISPESDVKAITLEAFFKLPVLLPYNGHILIDNLSHFEEVECKE